MSFFCRELLDERDLLEELPLLDDRERLLDDRERLLDDFALLLDALDRLLDALDLLREDLRPLPDLLEERLLPDLDLELVPWLAMCPPGG